MFKKITSGFLAVLMMMSAFVIVPPQIASAEVSGDYTYIIEGNAVTITAVAKTIVGAVEIPDKLPDSAGKPVTKIAANAFQDCTKMTSLKIPASVTVIDINVNFASCSALTAFTVDNANTAFTAVGGVLFNKDQTILRHYPAAKAETTYTIPNTVTSIGDNAFTSCSKLATVTMGTGVTFMGETAFAYCTALTAIAIPNSVKSIGVNAFKGCSLLATVTLGTGVEIIGENAFVGCVSLTDIVIPNSVRSIASFAFNSCSKLATVTLGTALTSIGNNAFVNCTALTAINIPANVATIGDYAFVDCGALTAFTVDSANTAFTAVDGVLFNKDKTILMNYPTAKADTSYTVPASVTTIKTYSFYKCQKLTSVVIPDTVTTIEDNAFVAPTTVKISCNIGSAAYTYAVTNNLLSISDIITVDNLTMVAPVKGAAPTNATTTSQFYDVTTTTWGKDGIDLAAGATFDGGSVYKAKVVLTAKTGNRFTAATTVPTGYTKTLSTDGATLTLEKTFPATDFNLITAVTITGIADPVVGAVITEAVSGDPAKYAVENMGTVWTEYSSTGEMQMRVGSAFDAGNTYKVNIILLSTTGNKFTNATTIPNGYTKTLMVSDGTKLIIEKTFPATQVSDIAAVTITGIVDPVVGEGLSDAVSGDPTKYTVEYMDTMWFRGANAISFNSTFEAGNEYTVKIQLTATAGNKFTNATTPPTGYTRGPMANDGSTLTIEKSFTLPQVSDIAAVTVTGIVNPVVGAGQTTAIVDAAAPYTATTIWCVGTGVGNPMNPDAKFEAGNVYKVQIQLTAKTGNKFTDATTFPTGYTKLAIGSGGSSLTLVQTFTLPQVSDIAAVTITGIVDPVVGDGISEATVDAAAPYTATNTKWYKDTSTTAMGTTDKFETGSTYGLIVVLTAKTGNKFTNETSIPTGYRKGEIAPDGSTLTIGKMLIFAIEKITAVTVTDIVAPVTGAGQSTAVSGDTSKYAVTTTSWYKGESTTAMASTDKFEGSSVYKVEIVLTATAGNKFTDATTFTGYTKKGVLGANGSTLTLEKTFPATQANLITAVTITGIVDPVVGDGISNAVSGDITKYNVASTNWSKDGNPMNPDAKFEAGNVYKVQIRLTATAGNKFTDATTFPTGYTKFAIGSRGGSLTIEQTFTRTTTKITNVRINNILDPVIGGGQSTAASDDVTKYNVASTSWSKDGNPMAADVKFEAGSTYKVVIVLTAQAGNEFTTETVIPIGYTKKSMPDGSTLIIEQSFTLAQVSDIAAVTITGIVDPVVGGGITAATADIAALYTATTTSWYKGESTTAMVSTDKFEGSSVYKVEIVLTATAGNKFTDATTFVGYTKKGLLGANGSTLTIEKTFPATQANAIAAVTITGIVDPVVGAGITAATADIAALYTATTTSWYKGESTTAMVSTDKFEGSSVYKVEIVLTVKDGNKFTDATTFVGYTKKAMAADGSTLTLEKTFESTKYIKMDMNGDGTITIADALLALKTEVTIIPVNPLVDPTNTVSDILNIIIQ